MKYYTLIAFKPDKEYYIGGGDYKTIHAELYRIDNLTKEEIIQRLFELLKNPKYIDEFSKEHAFSDFHIFEFEKLQDYDNSYEIYCIEEEARKLADNFNKEKEKQKKEKLNKEKQELEKQELEKQELEKQRKEYEKLKKLFENEKNNGFFELELNLNDVKKEIKKTMITYEKFLSDLKEKLEIEPWQSYTNSGINSKREVIGYEWCLGGTSGSCWDSHKSTVRGESEPEFKDLDSILELYCPDISFIKYKNLINKIVQTTSGGSSDYYGGHVDYGIKYIYLKDLFEWLKEKNYIE